MIIATAGHVDHGKTSLVNALTGIDTDRLIEEKERGLTIELGFAYADAETGGRLGFVDVPGHIRFINNMLAGVSAIDFCLMVIAADDGVMPQTVEHLEILDLLGISDGVIALTKIDRCDESQVSKAVEDITRLIDGSFLENSDIYPVSTITGEGIETLLIALDLAADAMTPKTDDGLFRLAIDRRFSIKGSGIVATGSVFAGSVEIGDELQLMPQNLTVRVRGLHTQNLQAESARAGDRCAINISSNQLQLGDIHRGNWLTNNPGAATSRTDIRLKILDAELKPFSHWTPVHIHAAANHVTGHVAILEQGRIDPGEEALAQLVFNPAINLCVGDRVIIRDQAATRTTGGGIVIDPYSPKRGRAKAQRLAILKLTDPTSAEASLAALINEAPLGLDTREFADKFNLSTEEMDSCLTGLKVTRLDENLVIDTELMKANLTELKQQLDTWHENNSGKAGLPLNQIQALVRRWPKALLDATVGQLVANEALIRDGNLLMRPGFGIQLNQHELALWNQALPLLQQNAIKPPVLHDLAGSLNIAPIKLEKILNQVAKTGQLVKPVKNRFFLPEAITELQQYMRDAADEKGQFTVKQYRDASGIGRNLCIELLEYFDRQGLTRRIGDIRQIMEN